MSVIWDEISDARSADTGGAGGGGAAGGGGGGGGGSWLRQLASAAHGRARRTCVRSVAILGRCVDHTEITPRSRRDHAEITPRSPIRTCSACLASSDRRIDPTSRARPSVSATRSSRGGGGWPSMPASVGSHATWICGGVTRGRLCSHATWICGGVTRGRLCPHATWTATM